MGKAIYSQNYINNPTIYNLNPNSSDRSVLIGTV